MADAADILLYIVSIVNLIARTNRSCLLSHAGQIRPAGVPSCAWRISWMDADGMGWHGVAWGGMGRHGMAWDGMGWIGWQWLDGMGWDGMGWNGMGWGGMGWVGWDGMGWDAMWDVNGIVVGYIQDDIHMHQRIVRVLVPDGRHAERGPEERRGPPRKEPGRLASQPPSYTDRSHNLPTHPRAPCAHLHAHQRIRPN